MITVFENNVNNPMNNSNFIKRKIVHFYTYEMFIKVKSLIERLLKNQGSNNATILNLRKITNITPNLKIYFFFSFYFGQLNLKAWLSLLIFHAGEQNLFEFNICTILNFFKVI